MNRQEIERILPHRAPMLLVDEAFVRPDGTAVGRYTVRGDEFFLQGHFPGHPVVPGVILCEMMAQSCAILMPGRTEPEHRTPMLTGLEKVKFRKPVVPGDIVEFSCTITKARGTFYFAQGKGRVGESVCVEGKFSFAWVEPGSDRKG